MTCAADAYDFRLIEKPGSVWRVLRSLFGALLFPWHSDASAYQLEIVRRDNGALVGKVDAGTDHYEAAGFRDSMVQRAQGMSPEQFVVT